MTKEDAIKEKAKRLEAIQVLSEFNDEYAKAIEVSQKRIFELDAIINAPEPDPRIGKLCWFGDSEPCDHMAVVHHVKDGCFYIKKDGLPWSIARPVTREEMESMLYVEPEEKMCRNCKYYHYKLKEEPCNTCNSKCNNWEPKPKTRYDWSKVPAEATCCTTDENGRQDAWLLKPHQGLISWCSDSPNNESFKIKEGDNSSSCPDWQDSLEEKPEGV